MNFDPTVAALAPIAICLVGIVLLWSTSQTRPTSSGDSIHRSLLLIGGWVMLLFGLLLGMGAMSQGLAIILWFASVVVIVATVVQFFASEQQSLLWVLTVAAERGVPLESAARAFGEERNDHVGRRAILLADYLEAGVPLSLALKRSGNYLPNAALLAADLGEETDSLGTALRQATFQLDEGEATLRSMLERVFYIAFLILFAFAVIMFVTVKIIPVLHRMLWEFGQEMPPTAEWLSAADRNLPHGWLLMFPLAALWLVVVVVGLLWYMGLAPRNLPVLNRLWWSADCAAVMRWLAMAIRQGRPIADIVRTLALRYPQAAMRARLERASSHIDRGSDWCDSLHQSGVIRRSESVLFKSAERVGNLPWALEEMADSGIRRSVYRIRSWLTIAFPVALVAMAGVVLFIALGVLMPLISLINGLS